MKMCGARGYRRMALVYRCSRFCSVYFSPIGLVQLRKSLRRTKHDVAFALVEPAMIVAVMVFNVVKKSQVL